MLTSHTPTLDTSVPLVYTHTHTPAMPDILPPHLLPPSHRYCPTSLGVNRITYNSPRTVRTPANSLPFPSNGRHLTLYARVHLTHLPAPGERVPFYWTLQDGGDQWLLQINVADCRHVVLVGTDPTIFRRWQTI